MTNAAMTAAATEIVSFAELHDGKERVTEIATYGFKGELTNELGFPVTNPDERFEFLNAIQDHAKSIAAGF